MHRRRNALLALFCVVAAAAALTTHTLERFHYWKSHANEPIQPWMNLGYISRAYGIPRAQLFEALGMAEPAGRDHRPVSALARLQKRPLLQELALLQRVVDRARRTPTP